MQQSTAHRSTPHSTPHATGAGCYASKTAPAWRATGERRRDRQPDRACAYTSLFGWRRKTTKSAKFENFSAVCDVTVTDPLADSNLASASKWPTKQANKAAGEKEEKYKNTAAALHAVHLPFAVETMGGLSDTAQRLLREIHHAASSGCT